MTINTKYLALLAALLLPASVFAQSFDSRATFTVSKDFDQAFAGQVELNVHLECTGGALLSQDITITEETNGSFFVYDIVNAPGDVFCTITEDEPDNYAVDYQIDGDSTDGSWDSDESDYDGCRWQLDPGSDADDTVDCIITNTPDPATITVNKEWVLSGADLGFDGDYKIKVRCDVGDKESPSNHLELFDTDSGDYHDWDWCGGDWCGAGVSSNYDEGDVYYEFTLYKPTYGGECVVYEELDDSVVQSSSDCGDGEPDGASVEAASSEGGSGGQEPDWFPVGAGDEIECTITNTVFFEGIPTLSQYGMAILALLMLGVGFVGFRRFV